MDELELIDETFDKDRTEVYELSIQVSLNGFSFAVMDTIRNTYIALISKSFSNSNINHDSWDAAVNEIGSSYPFILKKFKKVFFAYTLSPFTFVTRELFELDRIKSLFEVSQSVPDHFELHHTSVTNGSSYVLIFAVPYTLSSAWLKIQPKAKFVTASTSLLFNADLQKVKELLQVHFTEQYMSVVLHRDDKLVAANSFIFKNSDDAVYYILNFSKKLGVDTSAFVRIYGQYSDELTKVLSNYFPNASSDSHFNSIHFSYQLLRYRAKYFSLFNSTAICE
ncbi:hypothetical protein CYCD_26850 [Tenuifilaceae bacterium CYCD]|nr:hypothetical protein CYCD_26850 [Tenuifilaceae bacterium CYCD]